MNTQTKRSARLLTMIRIVILAAMLIGSIGIPGTVHALPISYGTIIQVNTTVDTIANDTVCSLPEAIANANANGKLYNDCDAGSGNDEIVFSSVLGNATITLTSILPGSTDSSGLTINGGGTITIDGDNNYHVLEVGQNAPLTLTNLTIENGKDPVNMDNAGGIYNFGMLTIINSTFYNNGSTDYAAGGAISNKGTLIIENSTFDHNQAKSGGSAILNFGPLTITNSTFSNNQDSLGNGTILNYSTLTIKNSTVSGNSASSGGGIYNETGGTLNQFNTIYANNTGGDCVNNSGTLTGNNNLIMDTGANACGLTNGLSGNVIGLDPKLGPLANNGGPTQTMAFSLGSPAVDAGDDAICAGTPVNNLDQRGVTRPQGAHCDIGAYELVQYSIFLPLLIR